MEEKLEVASFVVSIIALVASWLAIRNDRKIAETDIRADICGRIFDDYLIDEIPRARAKIRFDSADGKIKNSNALCDVISDMLYAALFYKYIDSSFYRELTEKCQELEDLLLMESDKKHIEEDDQKRVLHEIQENMEKVYHLIDAKKVGNSSH